METGGVLQKGWPFWHEKIEAQISYCRSHKDIKGRFLKILIPNDGFCWDCGNQIFNEISQVEAETTHITACPYCKRSFAE